MDKVKLFSTEKAILLDKLARGGQLDTEIKKFSPAKFKNPLPECRIGRYRSLDNRICVTAQIEIIKQYLTQNKELPSFLEAGPRERLYFDPAYVTFGIVTPGGIAPGLNTVIHSIVNMHNEIYGTRKQAYGFLSGFRGIVNEHFIKLDPTVTRDWIRKGASGLGVGRESKEHTVVEAIARHLEELGIDILYVIGGDGSLTAAHLVAQEIERRGNMKIIVAGIPKTMDNDILWVWNSFGFATAVEEATRMVNALHDEAKATERICLVPLFGRDAGFVAANTALASGQADVVLVPEVEFNIELLLDYIQKVIQGKGYALVVIAEGACPRGFTEQSVKEEIKKEGLNPEDRTNPRVSEALRAWRLYVLHKRFEEHFRDFRDGRHRVFINEPRYLIRAVPASATDQIYCQRLADMAVHNALAGFTDFMTSQWLTEYVLVPLDLVAKGNKKIPLGGVFWTTVTNCTGQPSFES